ncbi:MAG: tetratricopeptide repeat protein [Candidatus Xenobiia bacterium LiM19]
MSTHSQEQLFEEALALKKERRYREALPLYEELLRDGFRSAFFLSSAAHLHYLLRENEKALELVENSLRLRKDEPFTLSLKGKILFRLGYRDEAMAIFRELSLGALSSGSARDMITFLSRNGAPGEAAACLERLIEGNPSLKELRLLIEEGENAEHSAAPDKSAQFKDTADSDLYARQIETRIRELKPDEAIEELSTLLSIPSRRENRRLLSLLAKMLYGAKRYREAYEAYEELWKKDSRDRFALSQMAFSLVHTGEYGRAVPLLEEIFTVEPENMYVRNALMKAYRVTGTGEQGALFFKGIVASHPTLRHLWSDIRKLSTFPGPSAPSGVPEAPEDAGKSKKPGPPDAGEAAEKSKPQKHSGEKLPRLVSDDDCPFDFFEKEPCEEAPPSLPVKKRPGKKKKEST